MDKFSEIEKLLFPNGIRSKYQRPQGPRCNLWKSLRSSRRVVNDDMDNNSLKNDGLTGDFNVITRENEKAIQLMERILKDGKTIKDAITLLREGLKDVDSEIATVTKMRNMAKEAMEFQHGRSSKNTRGDANASPKRAAQGSESTPTASTSATTSTESEKPCSSAAAAAFIKKELFSDDEDNMDPEPFASIKREVETESEEEGDSRYSAAETLAKFSFFPVPDKPPSSSTTFNTAASSQSGNMFLTKPSANVSFENLSKMKDRTVRRVRQVESQEKY